LADKNIFSNPREDRIREKGKNGRESGEKKKRLGRGEIIIIARRIRSWAFSEEE
jgi:hypothetical protein